MVPMTTLQVSHSNDYLDQFVNCLYLNIDDCDGTKLPINFIPHATNGISLNDNSTLSDTMKLKKEGNFKYKSLDYFVLLCSIFSSFRHVSIWNVSCIRSVLFGRL